MKGVLLSHYTYVSEGRDSDVAWQHALHGWLHPAILGFFQCISFASKESAIPV